MADATVATDVRTPLAALTVEEFTDRLASAEPVPGGGSASAIAASLAASLLGMVAALTVGRQKYSDYAAGAEQAAAAAADLRHRFLRLADADAEAYAALVEAMRLPRESDAERAARGERLRAAARVASEVPLEMVRSAEDLAAGIEHLAGRSNINAASDLAVAALLTDAAAHGAAQNVLVNLPSVEDGEWEGRATLELDQRLDEIERLTSLTREVTGRGTLRDPAGA
jgi:formiminotetrahydrofolate cyclodeaminase